MWPPPDPNLNSKAAATAETQAERIFAKFGNGSKLARILGTLGRQYHKSSIYRWNYPRSKGGTGGWIPTAAWPDIILAARLEGILITSEDMDPRTYHLKRFR